MEMIPAPKSPACSNSRPPKSSPNIRISALLKFCFFTDVWALHKLFQGPSLQKQFSTGKFQTFTLQAFLLGYTLLAAQSAHAQLTWDANGTDTGQTNGSGAWFAANLWWNGATNQTWTAGSSATFGGPSTAGGAVTLASPTSVNAITFNTFTETYSLGTAGQTLTINGGIIKNPGTGTVYFYSPITLGAAQTWTNNSGTLRLMSTLNNSGHLLIIDGSYTTYMRDGTISGSGGLTKNGSGTLEIGSSISSVAHTYTGTTTLNRGVMRVVGDTTGVGNLGSGNLTLNGGVLSYLNTGNTVNFTRTLGSGAGEVQILGGASGFDFGSVGSVILNNNAAYEAVWGSTYFNPSALVLTAGSSGGTTTFANMLDLNGATRTVQVIYSSRTAEISGVIRTSTGTAGLTKTGLGILSLTNANTYNGGTTISEGTLRFADKNTMPASGNVTVSSGATLSVGVGIGDLWTTGTTGNGTIGGLLAGLGGQSGGTVSYSGNVYLGFDVADGTSSTYAGNIINVGTSLGLIKSGAGTMSLSGANTYSGKTTIVGGTLSFGSIGNIGVGNSALGAPSSTANGTINISDATLRYTGSGHSSNRVINLSGTTSVATLDASGGGAWILTSAITASSGAKTLTLTGTNTNANSLATTAMSSSTSVLTIQKSGVGTWWVGGCTSPKNAWLVTDGTLVVTGGITTGDQQVTVSGGTLAGTGPITLQPTKSLIVQAAGSLSPGNLAVGTLAVTGKLDIAGMAGGPGKLDFQLAAQDASDKIAVTGSAQIGSGLLGFNDFHFTDLGGITSGTYVLISTSEGIIGTLDPANRNGTIGSLTGTLYINGNNLECELVSDQDFDGLPDDYELANTTPPSATSLDPGDDLDGDGLTNLQEYQAGTGLNTSDSDDDGLIDGVETNTGVFLTGSDTGTNPLAFDTDGDAIRDGYETHTGVFLTGSDTGTNPLAFDTDSDGAGDWYEITATFTSPFLASEKPNIPYPLPDPDSSTGATNKPVKVYIMSGETNMVGVGYVNGTAPGSLETITKRENKFPNLITTGNAWTQRQDVLYKGVIGATAAGPLTAGQGADSPILYPKLGPELGFGHVMGYHHDEPVLLIKSSAGNRALGWDFRPPGSPRFDHTDGYTYPAYGESPDRWSTGTAGPTPIMWYAGKQFDDCFLAEADMGPPAWATAVSYPAGCQVRHNGVPYISESAHASNVDSEPGVGPQWATYWSLYSITNVVDVLDNFATYYPSWAEQGFEIAGFVWWQGTRDIFTHEPYRVHYEANMVQFIKQLRAYYTKRYPGKCFTTTPFILATGCGDPQTSGNGLTVANAQLAVSDPAKHPEFAGNVKTQDTRSYWRSSSESPSSNYSQYYNNAETYMLTGDALGRAMIDLQSATFAAWMTRYGVPPELAGFSQDADGDGIKNGVENFFGTAPNTPSGGLVSSSTSGNTFTFTHPQNTTPATGVTAAYRWSKDLTTFQGDGFTDTAGTTVSFSALTNSGITTVTATVTGTATAKLFVDVEVTQN